MKIVVSVKQVPARDSSLRVGGDEKWLDESDLSFEMNEPDAYALEEALQLREKLGGEVVVLCAGPVSAGQTVREALAKGADRAIHVQLDEAGGMDALATAGLLAAAIKPEAPDFVLTGLQSDDLGYGQTGVVLAELLGFCTRHDYDGSGAAGRRGTCETRVGGWLVPARDAAAAGGADHSIGH